MPPAHRHCHQCGTAYPLEGSPGRSETCEKCRADLKVCLNCAHHDLRAAHQCRDRRADPVEDKRTANFCEFFEFARKEWVAGAANPRETAARDRLRQLFGE